MTDLVKLTLAAGDGGDGRVSFRREKYAPKGGPDGGRGGDGGHVIITATSKVNTLRHFVGVRKYVAEAGEMGDKRKKIGAKGQNIELEVPVGTRVWLLAENEVSNRRRSRYGIEYLLSWDEVNHQQYVLEKEGRPIPYREPDEVKPVTAFAKVGQQFSSEQEEALTHLLESGSERILQSDFRALPKVEVIELTEPGQSVVICQGGFAGRGNDSFKGPERTTPLVAEYGTFGEQKVVILEQRMLADIGLVGWPNAGKSSLLSVLTKAKPKTANYPFTTLEPHLGIMEWRDREGAPVQTATMADIPGLIEGASEGKGLGHAFLRHVEHSRVLLYVLYLPEEVVFNQDLTDVEKVAQLWHQYELVRSEVVAYDVSLAHKKQLVALNKIDLYSPELLEAIEQHFKKQGVELLLVSAASQAGLQTLQKQLMGLV